MFLKHQNWKNFWKELDFSLKLFKSRFWPGVFFFFLPLFVCFSVRIKPSDFDYLRVIGRGSFGKVFFFFTSLVFFFFWVDIGAKVMFAKTITGAAGKTQKTRRLLCCESAAETGNCQTQRGNLHLSVSLSVSVYSHVSTHCCVCSRDTWCLRGAYCWRDSNIRSSSDFISLSKLQICFTLCWIT